MSLTYGAMFAGYGGLEMGVQSVLGGEMAWCAEFDAAAPSKVLAHHWPGVPNLGDVTKVDWAGVPKVDVVTGGSPCQDLSHAGKRAGMTTGTRSNLWAEMRDAISVIRPSLVVWENVRGAYSACADSEMGRCPRCVGGGPDVGHAPFLRALGRVLGDFSTLGYDTWWYGLRAADVGAPHGRFRIFVFATDANSVGYERTGATRGRGPGLEDHGLTVANTTGDGRDEGRAESARFVRGPDAPLSGHTPPADADMRGCEVGQELDSDPARAATDGGPGAAPADTTGRRRQDQQGSGVDAGITVRTLTGTSSRDSARNLAERVHGRRPSAPVVDWGQYAPAIHRWQSILGRVAPTPTETGPKGGQRLSPLFVEWLMGLPAGHVTHPAIGISRNDQLKALGNGVVPQQAAAATRMWLAAVRSEEVA